MAILPFIRQFAFVDQTWFAQSQYKRLNAWLTSGLESDLFKSCMHKYPAWQASLDNAILFANN